MVAIQPTKELDNHKPPTKTHNVWLVEIPQIHVTTQILKAKLTPETTQQLRVAVVVVVAIQPTKELDNHKPPTKTHTMCSGSDVSDSCNNTSTQTKQIVAVTL
ncbi:MAG: hypothetical protein P0116_08510 [Candidatus Nitrosocosmicus sp.]|nr:hypothetical protein [Candidatus Nitrosocosmicus sp.]